MRSCLTSNPFFFTHYKQVNLNYQTVYTAIFPRLFLSKYQHCSQVHYLVWRGHPFANRKGLATSIQHLCELVRPIKLLAWLFGNMYIRLGERVMQKTMASVFPGSSLVDLWRLIVKVKGILYSKNTEEHTKYANHISPTNCIPFRQVHNSRVPRPFLFAKGQPCQTIHYQ